MVGSFFLTKWSLAAAWICVARDEMRDLTSRIHEATSRGHAPPLRLTVADLPANWPVFLLPTGGFSPSSDEKLDYKSHKHMFLFFKKISRNETQLICPHRAGVQRFSLDHGSLTHPLIGCSRVVDDARSGIVRVSKKVLCVSDHRALLMVSRTSRPLARRMLQTSRNLLAGTSTVAAFALSPIKDGLQQ